MSSTLKFGSFSMTIFGESHGNAIGVTIDGLPSGFAVDFDAVNAFMARRAPRKDGTSTFRNEKDAFEILSGITDSKTNGAPLCAVIKNTDQHSADYKSVSYLARPGHADYTGSVRYNYSNDLRGGGHFSGRLTAPLVFAGAICGQLLEAEKIYSGAHIASIMNEADKRFDPVNVTKAVLDSVKSSYLPLIDKEKDAKMREIILEASKNLDSVGGTIECAIIGVPTGVGSPIFDGIENRISQIVFGIPAIKGIEFGVGFEVAKLHGSENNDEFFIENEEIKTRTNNCGGILGGISDSMPIIFRVAVKPTPSIAKAQKTVDYKSVTEETLEIKGRHDPCIVPRAVPCVEAAANIAIYTLLKESL